MKALSVDDIRVGDIVTLVRGRPYTTTRNDVTDAGVVTVTATHEDRSWKGDVLEILAIDLPYIVADSVPRKSRHGAPYKSMFQPNSFDTREGWTFARVSREYADALGCVIDWSKQASSLDESGGGA